MMQTMATETMHTKEDNKRGRTRARSATKRIRIKTKTTAIKTMVISAMASR